MLLLPKSVAKPVPAPLSICYAIACGNGGNSYNWRKKYAGLRASEVKRLRQLEDENNRLKKIVADLSLDKAMLQDVLSKNVWSAPFLQG